MVRKNAWNIDQYHAVVAEVRASLDTIREPGDGKALAAPDKVFQHCSQQIERLQNDSSDMARLRTYVYVLAVLVEQERYGGLPDSQVKAAVALGFQILRLQGINPEKSKLAMTFWNLHSICSQLLRKKGDHWLSAWEQSFAVRYAALNTSHEEAHHHLSLGNRSLRLGEAALALGEFRKGELGAGSSHILWKCRLAQLTGLRVSGQMPVFFDLLRESLKTEELTAGQKGEFLWEELCANLQTNGDFSAMYKSMRRGELHYKGGFVVEGCLWAMVLPSTEWLARLPSLESMKKNKVFEVKPLGAFYQIALSLQQAGDHELPVQVRINAVGEGLAEANRLVTIDKELLCWLAATRCLVRLRAYSLAILCLCQYRALSFRLSEGRSQDVLGQARDLLSSDWFSNKKLSETYAKK